MNLDTFINIVEGSLINRPPNFKYKICVDTRKIEEGDIFIPICFKDGNGNNYIEEAVLKKASLVLIPSSYLNSTNILLDILKINMDIGIIEIDDGLKALKRLASYSRDNYYGKVIAITGSNGKTSTKELLYLVLKEKYKTFKSIESYNNILGLCLMLLELKEEEYAIFELGMNHLGEISEMSKLLKPDIALITNIGTAHIGFLETKENILKAKQEILDGMTNDSILFINEEDEYLNKIEYSNIYRYPILEGKSNNNSTMIKIDDKEIMLDLKGRHNISNISAAYFIASYLDIDNKTFYKAIKEYKNIRMKEQYIDNTLIIDDSYNANYESMINGIDYVNNTNYKNKILVLGDILELGTDEIEIHKDVGKYIRNTNINKVYTYGDISKYIGYACQKISTHYNDKNLLVEELKKELLDNTIIYFKASHCIRLEHIIKLLIEE